MNVVVPSPSIGFHRRNTIFDHPNVVSVLAYSNQDNTGDDRQPDAERGPEHVVASFEPVFDYTETADLH